MNKIKLLVGLLIFVPMLSSAHGLVTTQTQKIDPYTIEFEYNTIGNIVAGNGSIFNVYLLTDNLQGVTFDSVFVKISAPNGAPVLFGTLKEASDSPGSARIGGIIRDSGIHTASVQFVKNGKTIGPLEYKFTVDSKVASTAHEWKKYAIYIPGGLGLIGLIAALILKIRRKKK